MAYIGKQPTPVPLTASDLDDDVISLAKMAGGTDGNLITYDASGNPVAVATGSDGQVLTSAGAGAPCLFEAAGGGGITNAQEFLMTSDLSGSAGTGQDITANIAENATASYGAIGSNVSQSSGIFSFSATGIYLVAFEVTGTTSSTDDFDCGIMITTDNSTYTVRALKWFNPRTSEPDKFQATIQTIVDVTNTTNVKLKFQIGVTNSAAGNVTFNGDSGAIETGFRFIRVGDT